jgi:hypothetical protein
MVVGETVDKKDLRKLVQQLDRLSLKNQDKELRRILASASLPIRKQTKAKAKRVISANNGSVFTRNGVNYNIDPGTLAKSIGVIHLKKSRIPAIAVGYKTKGKYNGWFAHFVDAGTAKRTTKGTKANRGSVGSRNIMETGISKLPQVDQRIKKGVLRVLKRLSK